MAQTKLNGIELGLRLAQAELHVNAVKAGWWDNIDKTDPKEIAVKLCLVHSEISEALEGVRKGWQDDHLPHRSMVEVELADAMIRIFDLAGAMKLDLAGAIIEKAEYNKTRHDHKREVRNAVGGKKI